MNGDEKKDEPVVHTFYVIPEGRWVNRTRELDLRESLLVSPACGRDRVQHTLAPICLRCVAKRSQN